MSRAVAAKSVYELLETLTDDQVKEAAAVKAPLHTISS
jgi:hypothetical protein